MATLPTPEECGRTVLKVFENLNCRPGHVVQINALSTYAANNHVPADDMNTGIDYGMKHGWFSATPSGALELTPQGFAEI